MTKIYKFLVLAFIAVAMLVFCVNKMEETTTTKDGVSVEKEAFLPRKSTLSVPPRG